MLLETPHRQKALPTFTENSILNLAADRSTDQTPVALLVSAAISFKASTKGKWHGKYHKGLQGLADSLR